MSEKLYQGCEPRIIERVPIHLKMVLTIREAAEYSNIGINKICLLYTSDAADEL